VFFPQYVASFQLAGFSAREGRSLAFALWGSFPPINFIGTILPSVVFGGARIYIGVFGLFFSIVSLVYLKKERKIVPLATMFMLSIFVALGKYNPIYTLILKFTKMYSMRNPSKILILGAFCASVLAGLGFTYFINKKNLLQRKSTTIFISIVGIFVGGLLVIKGALIFFKQQIINIGEWYVLKYVFGKEFHRHSLETYMLKINNIYDRFLAQLSFANLYLLASLALSLLAIGVCLYISRNKKIKDWVKGVIVGIVFVDLFIFHF